MGQYIHKRVVERMPADNNNEVLDNFMSTDRLSSRPNGVATEQNNTHEGMCVLRSLLRRILKQGLMFFYSTATFRS